MGQSREKRTRRRRRATSIFDRLKLRPGQLRGVADRRFGDASCLERTGQNARANGALYLGGFVIECLLKAKLLEKYRWLQNAGSPERLDKKRKRLWLLCYRLHALDELLGNLPEVTDRLKAREQRGAQRLTQSLQGICARWTIFARYSPQSATIHEAREFLTQVKELRPWLR